MTAYEDIFYPSPDGLTLYARDYNSVPPNAPTIVCIPGLTRNSRDFAEIAEHMAGQLRVLCVELRGRGKSNYDPTFENYNPGTYVKDIVALLDQLKIEQVILLGTSLGGIVSMLISTLSPERVQAVIMNDIGPVVDQTGLARIQSYVGKSPPVTSWADAVAQIKQTGVDAFPNYDDDQWLALAHKLFLEDETSTPVLDYDPNISKPFGAANEGPSDMWALFEAVQQKPLLLIRGALSDILARDIFDEMLTRHTNAQSVELANIGHAPMLDEPDAISAIDGFLASLAS